ncbi:hypothetical protein, partial [Streptomyces glaucescens]|uniref:hypothetical protein n=1 Tax=Streptomyces glaucescens TaxID=1907 RepID=UPI001FEB0311
MAREGAFGRAVEDECAACQPGQHEQEAEVAEDQREEGDDQEAAQEVRQVEQQVADGGGVGTALLGGDVDAAPVGGDVVGVRRVAGSRRR